MTAAANALLQIPSAAAVVAPDPNAPDLDRTAWLRWRQKGLGGSDAAAIVGLDPFRSAMMVWLERLSLGTGTGTGFTLASLLLEHLATKREARCLVFAAAQLVVRCCDRAPVQTGDHPSDRSPFSFRSGPPAAPC